MKTRNIPLWALVSLMMSALSSCGVVFDDLPPCPTGVSLRFVYDYNVESADAFASQVDCLTVHVYDSEGRHVADITPPPQDLADKNMRVRVDLPAGSYHVVAYGGISCGKASFAHTSAPVAGSHYTDISMHVKETHIGTLLHDHFHGILDFTVEDTGPEYKEETVEMTKTTNNFRILLKQLNDEQLRGEDFEFHITDDNRELDHTNTPVPSGHDITYPAWTRGENSGVAYGEISTSRLHLSTTPHLIIKSKNDTRVSDSDNVIVDLPLNKYLLMTKSDASGWGDQEYLDRCSTWNMTFFLDSDLRWSQTRIIINDWVIRINDLEQ